MHTLNMKITGYDEDSQSLLVVFASDETASSNPEDYAAVAFQPTIMWPEVTDMAEILKRIALSGVEHVKYIAATEKAVTDTTKITTMQSWVGQTVTYALDDLVEQVVVTPFQVV